MGSSKSAPWQGARVCALCSREELAAGKGVRHASQHARAAVPTQASGTDTHARAARLNTAAGSTRSPGSLQVQAALLILPQLPAVQLRKGKI